MNKANKRKKYSAEEKVRLLRPHLTEKEPVSPINRTKAKTIPAITPNKKFL